jgi:hypothetical protein
MKQVFHSFAVVLVLTLCVSTSLLAQWAGSDEDFVAMVETRNWDYFVNNQGGPFSFFRGHGAYNDTYSYDSVNTCAGDGYGIASLVVGAYRGWMTDEEAYNRILPLLQSYDTELAQDGNGFFNHFYEFDTGNPTAEYSSIDTTWFLCGALLAAEYFKGTEIDNLAHQIYSTVNFASQSPYTGYHEYMMLNVLGAGSPTHAWDPGTSRAGWNAAVASPNLWGPLFFYQWPQNFVDFRFYTDDSGRNHFFLARQAMLNQRDKCISMHNSDPSNYPDFGTNGWGMTSASASMGYLELRPFGGYCTANLNYGFPDYCTNLVASDEEACDSGTLVPICVPACMPHVPYETRECMKALYNNHGFAFSTYSFINAMNNGAASSGSPHYSAVNASMDYGANVLALENFRSGMPWKYFMRNTYVQNGLANCGIVRTNWVPWNENFDDGSDPNAWDGGSSFENTDGSDPSATYSNIAAFNAWVDGYAYAMTANGSGDTVRITFAPYNENKKDQSKNDMLSFWLRGTTGGEELHVGLRDWEDHEVTVPLSNYVNSGVISTNWTRVRIPLKPCAVTGDPNEEVRLTHLDDISFHFNGSGTVLIDDLAFLLDDISPEPPSVGAACVDGRVQLRWGYSTHDDVVGYHLWRRPDTVSGFKRLNSDLLSAQHDEQDVTVESQWGEDFFYTAQCVDRNGNAGSFAGGPYEQRVWIGRHHDVDYGDGENPNTFGGTDGRWGSGWGDIRFQEETGWDGRTRWVRVMESDAPDGVFISLNSGDISAYDVLAFRIKQNWGAEAIDIGLKSTDLAEVKVAVTNYLPGGDLTNVWTLVRVPLIDFKGVDFSSIDNLSFSFQDAGSVYADDIRFECRTPEDGIRLVAEGEDADDFAGGNTNDFKWYASQAYTLGNSWAQNGGEYAEFTFLPTQALNEAYLDVRYACGGSSARSLEVLLNGTNTGSLTFDTTGGWGDEAAHFEEVTHRLGSIASGTCTIRLEAASAGTAINLDRLVLRSAAHYFREAEDFDGQTGSGGDDFKAGAEGGEVLGNGWGGTNGSEATYSNIVLNTSLTSAVLRLRYGQNWGDGRLFRVYVDGTNMGRIACAYTGGWLDEYAGGTLTELPLGSLAAGLHTLRIAAEGDDEAINVDWLQIAGSPATLNGFDTDGDGLTDDQEGLYGTLATDGDTDGDGLDDLTEISRLGGFPSDPLKQDGDNDGQNDDEELLAGTDPQNDSSAFIFSTCTPYAGGMALSWPGDTSRTYAVFYSDSFPASTSTFTAVTTPGAITRTNGFMEYRDDGSGTTPPPNDPAVRRRTYRVRVRR